MERLTSEAVPFDQLVASIEIVLDHTRVEISITFTTAWCFFSRASIFISDSTLNFRQVKTWLLKTLDQLVASIEIMLDDIGYVIRIGVWRFFGAQLSLPLIALKTIGN